ncbi:MAG: glycosyltransferase family 2 protein [Acidobacteriia bacterium]|nr:glycosyltransferase family 2 protein [Terriglobia bacterium]
MENEKSVTVIVVNWNSRDLLRECLFSLRRQTYRNFHVIVVDNGSIDGSLEMLENEFAGFAYLIKNSRNHGFCRAVNQAILASRSDYVALLNNDAEAQPTWLEEMAAVVERAEDIGMCASKILKHDQPDVIDKVGHLIYLDGQNRGRGTGQADRGQFDQEEETLFPDGCAALYRRAVFDAVGLFDEDFFAYGDDAELGLRARLGGWRAIYSPRAVVYHRHSQTLGAYSPEKIFYVERNRVWLAVKLFPLPILLLNPYYAGLRFVVGMMGSVLRKGPAGSFAREYSILRLIWTLLRANLSALVRVPRMWKKRVEVKRRQKISNDELRRLLFQFRIGLKELALE